VAEYSRSYVGDVPGDGTRYPVPLPWETDAGASVADTSAKLAVEELDTHLPWNGLFEPSPKVAVKPVRTSAGSSSCAGCAPG
jgi:hypothetical protein